MSEFPNINYKEFSNHHSCDENCSTTSETSYISQDSRNNIENTLYLSVNDNNSIMSDNIQEHIDYNVNNNQDNVNNSYNVNNNSYNENNSDNINFSTQRNINNSLSTINLQKSDNLLINENTDFYTTYNDTYSKDNLDYIAYSDNKDNNLFNQINSDLNDTQEHLRNNITKMVDRDLKLNNLETNTSSLLDGAKKFNNSSRALKFKMFQKYILHILSIIILIVLIITLIVILVK